MTWESFPEALRGFFLLRSQGILSMSTVHADDVHPPRSLRGNGRGGFTMIELIVVIGIIILAAGMMTPQITDFFKGRQLKQLTSAFRSAINSARLKAVNERTRVRLVFFREGIRVYDEREAKFIDELFNPEASVFAGEKAWYVLGFYQDTPSVSLQRFRDWEAKFTSKKRKPRSKKARRTASIDAGPPPLTLKQLAGLPQIIFRRDGAVEFNVGSDVSSIFYKRKPPTGADLIIYVKSNTSACYIDIQLTGQNRSKVVTLESEPRPPLDPTASASKSGKKGKRKKGKRSGT
jgi:type II secretory pathway pseudopilin PulG